jgi:hypothetical protein
MSKEQPDFFADAPARYPDAPGHRRVDTSVAAARSMWPHFGRLQKKILDHIRGCGPRGAMYTEIMDALKLGAPTVAARLRELRAADAIVRSGKKRKTPSGRFAHVWIEKMMAT